MRIAKRLFVLVSVFFLIFASAYVGYSLAYIGLILPKIQIAGIEVGGLDKVSATNYLKKKAEAEPNKIVYWYADKEIEGINKIQNKQDITWAVDQAYSIGRNGGLPTIIKDRLERLNKVRTVAIPVEFSSDDMEEAVDQIAAKVESEPIWPKLTEVNNQVILRKGKNGNQVAKEDLKKEIRVAMTKLGKQEVNIPMIVINTEVDQSRIDKVIMTVSSWDESGLNLRYKDFSKKLSKREILPLVGLGNDEVDEKEFEKLLTEIKIEIETESKDAVFDFNEGRVTAFQPEVVGVKVDVGNFRKRLGDIFEGTSGKKEVEIPVILDYPKIKAGEINNMGIKELIGFGTSSFSHSIPGRVFNVNLAGSRIHGVVVPPGEEFSFNKAVGQISRTTGYQTAYVISEGRTVLGDGGGVCQVSTTVFRAALNAGFQITERKAHAYRVGYYEQDSSPGIDATIFSPSTDLKFLNDTGHYILIQAKVDTKNLKMRVEIYGTSDGRVATVGKPVITSQSAPPPTLYTDDPTLPAGQLKQIDFAAGGAKVSFSYKVERGGETLFEKTFFSNYQPWRAVYLRGTGQ